ncbi:methyltransferase family protein [Planctomicrobium sp. SH527]|uniref:methyltransferase family protein n=1 Tax=Planctomicrobium sp. SH527 TaxID=3448123 RepID=UPI003F5C58F0
MRSTQLERQMNSPVAAAIQLAPQQQVELDSSERVTPQRVKQFQSYRMRLPLTSFCLILGFSIALCSRPRITINGFLEQFIDAAGYLLIIAGIGIRLWSISTIASRKSVQLVTNGPYSLCRNPLYIGTLLISMGFLCLVQNLTMATLTLPIILLYIFGVVPAEEKVLRSIHGSAFDSYCASTSRWLPKSFSMKRLYSNPIWTKGVRREFECAVWWLVIAAAVHITCDLRMEAWWPHPFDMP